MPITVLEKKKEKVFLFIRNYKKFSPSVTIAYVVIFAQASIYVIMFLNVRYIV